MAAIPFRFATEEHVPAATDQERLNCLAACIANQQQAGFKDYLDTREIHCETCGASGFNTGWGFFEFACGATLLSDGEGGDPCPKEAAG
jgi:hypothetical protein